MNLTSPQNLPKKKGSHFKQMNLSSPQKEGQSPRNGNHFKQMNLTSPQNLPKKKGSHFKQMNRTSPQKEGLSPQNLPKKKGSRFKHMNLTSPQKEGQSLQANEPNVTPKGGEPWPPMRFEPLPPPKSRKLPPPKWLWAPLKDPPQFEFRSNPGVLGWVFSCEASQNRIHWLHDVEAIGNPRCSLGPSRSPSCKALIKHIYNKPCMYIYVANMHAHLQTCCTGKKWIHTTTHLVRSADPRL